MDKLLSKFSYVLDMSQNYLISLIPDEDERKAEEDRVNKNYQSYELTLEPKLQQLVRDLRKIPEHTLLSINDNLS